MKPFKLEVGKRYIDRDGNVCGPLFSNGDGNCNYPFCGENGGTWTAEGKWHLDVPNDHRDLVAEYVEPANDPESDAAIQDRDSEINFTIASLEVAEQALREQPYERLPYLAGTLALTRFLMERLRQGCQDRSVD